MYRTCLACKRGLGRNRRLEFLPVGRRVAFDPWRGRLWVVCPHCARWNLVPLEERWETIETCERRYRQTRLRAGSGEIQLIGLGADLELIRIGEPSAPELAAWRFGRRQLRWPSPVRRKAALLQARARGFHYDPGAPRLLRIIPLEDAGRILWRAPGAGTAWAFDRPLAEVEPDLPFGLISLRADLPLCQPFAGVRGLRFAAGLFAVLNATLPAARLLPEALAWLDRHGNPFEPESGPDLPPSLRSTCHVVLLDPVTRLALEMAANDAEERRFLQGELDALRAAWRDAEQLAAIADRLGVPEWIEQWIAARRPPRNEFRSLPDTWARLAP
ncbi:MAG: hypothetical protein AB7L66_14560 [Gemmatimonadales bacterium]